MLTFVQSSEGDGSKPPWRITSRQREYCLNWFLGSFSVSLSFFCQSSPYIFVSHGFCFLFISVIEVIITFLSNLCNKQLLDAREPDRFCQQLNQFSPMSLKSISFLPLTRCSARYVPLYLSTAIWLSLDPRFVFWKHIKSQTHHLTVYLIKVDCHLQAIQAKCLCGSIKVLRSWAEIQLHLLLLPPCMSPVLEL